MIRFPFKPGPMKEPTDWVDKDVYRLLEGQGKWYHAVKRKGEKSYKKYSMYC
jgi:hypothetical protein